MDKKNTLFDQENFFSDVEEDNKSDADDFLNEAPIEDVLNNLNGKKKSAKRKSRWMGLLAFAFSLLAIIVLALVTANALRSYVLRELSEAHISLLIKGIFAVAVLSVISILIALITFFVRKQKKGFAVTATIFSILLLLFSGVAIYAYQYTFGAMQQDNDFNKLSHDALFAVQTEHDGEISRETIHQSMNAADEEVEFLIMQQQEENPKLEIEWENLTDLDIPQEALNKMNTGAPQGKSYLTGDHEQISNFLLFGLDESGSSDSIMIFSFDRVHHKLKLISLPRDSYVKIPAWGSYAKLAYPYVWGGAEWAVGTINLNFSMNITEYITVDMEQLKDIIDLIGGVYVNLDWAEVTYLQKFSGIHYGDCLLQGDAAVMYARIRESSATDNEENRTSRQREIIMSILKSVQSMSWKEYPELVRTCLSMCTTSFEIEQLMGLCTEVVQNGYTVEQYALIANVDYWGGKLGQEGYFYVVYDLNRASDVLYRLIYEDLYISGYEDETP